MAPTTSSAQTVESSYVACNQDGACWRTHRLYAYGADRPITYHSSDWYSAHQNDEHVHWLSDPADDRGYYERDGRWHAWGAGVGDEEHDGFIAGLAAMNVVYGFGEGLSLMKDPGFAADLVVHGKRS